MLKSDNLPRLAFVLLLLAFIAYGLAFIQRTTFEIDGQPFHTLFDDAMISMQYARNFANGDGLVWNAGGERVEGYSNFLWVLIMAAAHRLPPSLIQPTHFIQLLSLLFLALNLIVVRALALEFTENRWLPLVAVFLTAFYFPLNNWSLQGMEVGLLILLINAALLLSLRAQQRQVFSPWAYLLLGLAVLLRMDAAVLALLLTAGMAWLDVPRRKQHLFWGLGTLGIVLGGLTLFRLLYYGAWLPNTYYLKLSGVSLPLRISLGLKLLGDFLWSSNWALMLLPFSLLLIDRRRSLKLLFAMLLAQFAYSAYVGGDSWEHVGGANRFVVVVMPLFFTLFALTLGALSRLALKQVKTTPPWPNALAAAAIILFTAISLLNFNTLSVRDGFSKWTLAEKPIFVSGEERYTRMGLTLARVTAEDAVIAVVSAGTLPYYSERKSIDLMGKNDPVIARLPARINASLFHPGNFRPGHNKWDYAYSIGELNPDVVAQTWENTDDEVAPYLQNYEMRYIAGIPYYFRLDSPHILWDEIPPQD